MKKIIIIFSLFFIFLVTHVNNIYALDQNVIHNIDINMQIDKNGHAHIVEKWDISVHNGTEIYKIMNHLDDSYISDFSVTDESGYNFRLMDDWDIGRSRDYKSYKCGIIEDGSHYELCFGIGDYGTRQYTISYTITDLVKNYSNQQGFNIHLLSDFTLNVENVYIDIITPYKLNANNTQIWGFGFNGTMIFDNNHIIIENSEELILGQQMQIITNFKDKYFDNLKYESRSINSIVKQMKKNSDYNSEQYDINNTYNAFLIEEDYSLMYFLIGIILIGVIGIFGLISYSFKAFYCNSFNFYLAISL